LGLATVFSILRRHQGWVEVTSSPGNGSTFHLFLPASRSAADLVSAPVEAWVHRGSGSVLIMDDDPQVLEVTGLWLESMGYEVESCRNSIQILEAISNARARGLRFQAVLLDLTIPGARGGAELARILVEGDPSLVLIASTGYTENPVMAHPDEYGFRGTLMKPYQKKDLSRLLVSLFPGSADHRES
jgi:CheY-like chemotaxis protein